MSDDLLQGQHPPREAYYVFGYLARRGGCMRLAPMARHLRLEPEVLVSTLVELAERYWIKIVWRPPPPGTPGDGPRPYTEIDRLVTTRFGRRKYRSSRPQM